MSTNIPSQTITEEFAKCWNAAGVHLSKQSDAPLNWIKATLKGLVMEHFSFRLGNQIFFVQIEDVDGNLVYPSQREAFLKKAEEWNGVPCTMPMKNVACEWRPQLPNWGLQHAITRELIIPPALITGEEIEISNAELQDLAVQVTRNKLIELGKEVTSTQSDPRINPSIWFVDNEKLCWVIVRAARHPAHSAQMPDNFEGIAKNLIDAGYNGYFESVVVASADDPFDPNAQNSGNFVPLMRGRAYMCKHSNHTENSTGKTWWED